MMMSVTAQETSSSHSHGSRWFSYAWHPAAILLLLVVGYLGTNILAQLHNPSDPDHGDISFGLVPILLATTILFVIEVVGVVKALSSRNLPRAAWQSLAATLLVASIVFARQTMWAIQFTNLLLFPSRFAACEHNAQAYGTEGKFNVCNIQSFGCGFFVIVYDSGREIEQPEQQQSQPFKDVLKASGGLLSEGSRHLSEHFYLVDANCDQ